MRKLFVSDLDGTLLNNQSQVSAESTEILNRSIASGALFSIATARTPATVSSLLSKIDMRLPGIVMTGGAFFDFKEKKITNPKFMEAATASRLVEDWKKSGLSTFIYTLDHKGILQVYHIGSLSEVEREFMKQRSHSPCKVFNVPDHGESILPDDLSRTMLMFGMQPDEKALPFYRKICSDYGNSVITQYYHDIFGDSVAMVEMFPPGVTKASALEKLASDVGADRLIVFGDNINDIPMMRIADEAVAVGNASDEVKEAATAVIGSNDSDAVAKFIRSETIN